tara:strand:+ start:4835 stop:7330 length:2496 start_codon:yes stop_codon:yes gene_type:complete
MTNRDYGLARVRALRNILTLEIDNGFQDKAVSGGLDGFLKTLVSEPNSHPAIKTLFEHGLLSAQYSELSVEKRKIWHEEVQKYLGNQAESKGNPKKPEREIKAQPEKLPYLGLDAPISALKSVNRPNASRLGKIGINFVRDLIYLFPNRHLDYTARRTISQLIPENEQTIVATVWEAREVRLGRSGRMRATEAVVGDETGNIKVIWFGQPWLAMSLKRAMAHSAETANVPVQIVLSGKVKIFNGRQQLDSPEWEILDDPEAGDLLHTGRLVPIYPSTDGIPARTMRRMVREAIDSISPEGALEIDDPLPASLIQELELPDLPWSISQSHFPESLENKELARRRLAFDELLVLQLALTSKRSASVEQPGITILPFPPLVTNFIASLPFQLTEGQKQALDIGMQEISIAAKPMTRLLQGDVGSGKTVVALALLLAAVADGYQGAMMAPTGVLAEQHYFNLRRLLSEVALPIENPDWFSVELYGFEKPIVIALLTGSTKAAARREIHRMLTDGILNILVGTHALIQTDVEIPNLAIAVVDEQHRFGVMQRAALKGKGTAPHLLLMSATPIPRTLSATIYGDLDVSTMQELPKGRKQIRTRIVPSSRAGDAEKFLREQVQMGRQCFVVCPLIEESEAVMAQAATVEYERLSASSFSDIQVGLLHGQMETLEKQKIMDEFRAGKIDILVATSVIEVGIDVPNATVMMILGADRFGLAQLHQLRGRVGRGEHQSYCFLLSETLSEDSRKRLEVLVRTNDGFEIAEADLSLRGPGDFFGTRQSGLPTLRMASLQDRDLVSASKEQASNLFLSSRQLDLLPALKDSVSRYMNAVAEENA